jgi:aspartyl protease family protein
MTDNAANLIWGVGALVLVGSAFLAHRVPAGRALKMGLAWIAIFAVGLAIVSQRDALGRIWGDMQRDLFGARQQVEGSTLRVPMSADGHFWVDAEINGQSTRLLIDSGASLTALSGETARLSNVDVDRGRFPVTLNTANGEVQAYRARAERLSIGPIDAHDLPIVVSDAFGRTSVLGMNFLSQLRSWRVEGRTLILEPNAG